MKAKNWDTEDDLRRKALVGFAEEMGILCSPHDPGVGFKALADAEAFAEIAGEGYGPLRVKAGNHWLQSRWIVGLC